MKTGKQKKKRKWGKEGKMEIQFKKEDMKKGEEMRKWREW